MVESGGGRGFRGAWTGRLWRVWTGKREGVIGFVQGEAANDKRCDAFCFCPCMNLLFWFSMGGAQGPTAEIAHCRGFAPCGHAHPARHNKVQASKEAIRAKTKANYSRSYLDFADAAALEFHRAAFGHLGNG